jgi:hypothetical protein
MANAYVDLAQDLLSPVVLPAPPPRPLLASLTRQLSLLPPSDTLAQLVSLVLRSPSLWPSPKKTAFTTGTAIFDAFSQSCFFRAGDALRFRLGRFVNTVLSVIERESTDASAVLRLVIASALFAGLEAAGSGGMVAHKVENAVLALWPAVLGELGDLRESRRHFVKPEGMWL